MKSERVNLLLLSGLGSGLISLAPGTWSSALALHASHPLLLQFATVGGVLVVRAPEAGQGTGLTRREAISCSVLR